MWARICFLYRITKDEGRDIVGNEWTSVAYLMTLEENHLINGIFRHMCTHGNYKKTNEQTQSGANGPQSTRMGNELERSAVSKPCI